MVEAAFTKWRDPSSQTRTEANPGVNPLVWEIAETTRQTRSAVLEVRNKDFVRTLRAIGLPNRTIFKHVAKNIAVPVSTVVGLQASRLLGATVIVEAVFGINGVGSLVVDSVGHRDYPMVQGVVIVMALIILAVNLLVDVTYRILDPRIR